MGIFNSVLRIRIQIRELNQRDTVHGSMTDLCFCINKPSDFNTRSRCADVFLNVTLWGLVDVHRRFKGTYCLDYQYKWWMIIKQCHTPEDRKRYCDQRIRGKLDYLIQLFFANTAYTYCVQVLIKINALNDNCAGNIARGTEIFCSGDSQVRFLFRSLFAIKPELPPPPSFLTRILSSDINLQHASALMESMHYDIIKQDIKKERISAIWYKLAGRKERNLSTFIQIQVMYENEGAY
jgi:hypothetical protein